MRKRQEQSSAPQMTGVAPRYCAAVMHPSVPQAGHARTAKNTASIAALNDSASASKITSPGCIAARVISSTWCRFVACFPGWWGCASEYAWRAGRGGRTDERLRFTPKPPRNRALARTESHVIRDGLVHTRDRPQPLNHPDTAARGGTRISLAHATAPFPKRNCNPKVGRDGKTPHHSVCCPSCVLFQGVSAGWKENLKN